MKDPHFQSERVALYHGYCLEVMRELADESVHAVVTDPPYGLGFMGRAWDALPPGEEFAREALRVLKPGGHMLAFGGSRTWHRLAVAIEDAGFEIRDSIAWLYGSGFPKSLNVAKAIATGGGRPEDIRRAAMGDDYAPSGRGRVNYDHGGGSAMNGSTVDVPLTPDAEQWQGWGTALKPAFEPIVVARKPIAGTVAANVLEHGTGSLNIDGCRVGDGERPVMVRTSTTVAASSMSGESTGATSSGETTRLGRWPANVILDESQAAELDRQSGIQKDGTAVNRNRSADEQRSWYGTRKSQTGEDVGYGGMGGASRFFPVFRFEAKAPSSERPNVDGVQHPTVKPLALMRWLCRLVTPRGGVILEPFAGSGTTLEAAILEGFDVIGIEREADYLPLIMFRVRKDHEVVMDLWGGEAA